MLIRLFILSGIELMLLSIIAVLKIIPLEINFLLIMKQKVLDIARILVYLVKNGRDTTLSLI